VKSDAVIEGFDVIEDGGASLGEVAEAVVNPIPYFLHFYKLMDEGKEWCLVFTCGGVLSVKF
jgi:hypothetical protein